MNYLAHLFLSGNDTELRIGNFIADSVRGKDFSAFPDRVADGIMLHRYIDSFTDSNKIVRKSKDLIRSEYGHWSSVIVDLYYDHFLACNWNDFHPESLETYSEKFYKDLTRNYDFLPEKVQKFMPNMIQQNWLLKYSTIEGISDIFYQMNNRTGKRSKMNLASKELELHYEKLEHHFRLFMVDLQDYVESIT